MLTEAETRKTFLEMQLNIYEIRNDNDSVITFLGLFVGFVCGHEACSMVVEVFMSRDLFLLLQVITFVKEWKYKRKTVGKKTRKLICRQMQIYM